MRPKVGPNFKADAVNAARVLFLTNGVESTSMDDVAKALGVSKPTVYEHFASKKLLLDEVFDAATKDVELDWLEKAKQSNMPFHEFLRATALVCIEFVRTPRKVEAYQMVVREGPRSAVLRDAFLSYLGRPTAITMRKVIKAAIERGECRKVDVDVVQRMITAPMYFAMTERAIFGQNAMSMDELTAYFNESFQVLIDSLCVRPTGP